MAHGVWYGVALAFCLPAAAQQQDAVPTFGITVVIPSGLQGQVYHIPRNTARLPDFHKIKPRGSVYTTSLNIPPQSFKQGFPGVTKRFEWFAIDYTGRFWIEREGEYRFQLTSDDGSNLYIDDRLIVENDGLHAPLDGEGSAMLESGVHRIRVSYFQGPREQVALVLKIAGPGEELRIFSTDEFKPPSQEK
ncbi:MAG TPA: PA14 domain-containing protein [Bryobacteraceae bacterium]|jgi:hypothetical protein